MQSKYTRRAALAGMAGGAALPIVGAPAVGMPDGEDDPIIGMAEELVTLVREFRRSSISG